MPADAWASDNVTETLRAEATIPQENCQIQILYHSEEKKKNGSDTIGNRADVEKGNGSENFYEVRAIRFTNSLQKKN